MTKIIDPRSFGLFAPIPDGKFKKKPKTKTTQAERVIEKFGGPLRLARIFKALGIDRHPVTVYKWMYPKSKGGTGGLIPTGAWPDIYKAARIEGVLITTRETDPREF